MDSVVPHFVLEPFSHGRQTARLLHDFAVMLSLFSDHENKQVLDFAAGSGWISEFLNKCGYDVSGIDINAHSKHCYEARAASDSRVQRSRLRFIHHDGHHLPFPDRMFGHVVCFDSLHHMEDFGTVLGEMYRVLDDRGKAVFVEPGALHSQSKETIEFVATQKQHDPAWFEKDIVLETIAELSNAAGFQEMRVAPHLLPGMTPYLVSDWLHCAKADPQHIGGEYMQALADLNYNQRVIFCLQK